jgi:hypothetical protein
MDMNFTSTATTINPVTGEMSLNCSDGVISKAAFIHIIDNVSSTQNVSFVDITGHQVVLSWDPPVTNPHCVTGYYIANFNKMIDSEISGTTATISVNINECYGFAVTAMYGNGESSSIGESICIEVPRINDTSILTAGNIITLSWEFVPNIPNISLLRVLSQSIIFNGTPSVIGADDRNWTFSFEENQNYTIDLLATNVIGENYIRLFYGQRLKILSPPPIDYIISTYVIAGAFLLIIIFFICITFYAGFVTCKWKKLHEEQSNAVELQQKL